MRWCAEVTNNECDRPQLNELESFSNTSDCHGNHEPPNLLLRKHAKINKSFHIHTFKQHHPSHYICILVSPFCPCTFQEQLIHSCLHTILDECKHAYKSYFQNNTISIYWAQTLLSTSKNYIQLPHNQKRIYGAKLRLPYQPNLGLQSVCFLSKTFLHD